MKALTLLALAILTSPLILAQNWTVKRVTDPLTDIEVIATGTRTKDGKAMLFVACRENVVFLGLNAVDPWLKFRPSYNNYSAVEYRLGSQKSESAYWVLENEGKSLIARPPMDRKNFISTAAQDQKNTKILIASLPLYDRFIIRIRDGNHTFFFGLSDLDLTPIREACDWPESR